MDATTMSIMAPVNGQAVPLTAVPDEVFSKGVMGQGFGIEPTDGTLVSPVTGKIVLIAETKHAIGFELTNGVQLLLHLGVDTVELKGAPFDFDVTMDQAVTAGQAIGTMDLAQIKDAGKDTTAILVVTNSAEKVADLQLTTGTVTAGQAVATVGLKAADAEQHLKARQAASQLTGYDALAANIIQYVGGAENVKHVIHCITRLRFYLKDEALANDDEIRDLDGVLDVAKAQGQYQVVIGPAVADVFDAVAKQLGITDATTDPSEEDHLPDNRNFGQKIKDGFNLLMGVITGAMAPIIGILSASGVIKGFMAIFTTFHIIGNTSNVYMIMNAMSDAVFYFLPILIGFNAAKRLGGNATLAAVIGGIIAYPTLLTAAGKNLDIMSIGFIHFPFVSYTYSVFPMIVAAWMVVKLEKWLKTWMPSYLQAIFIPAIIIGVVTTVTLLVTGPVITWLADGLAHGVQTVIGFNSAIFGGVIDGFYQILVIFGLHWGLVPLYVNDFATMGHSYLFAITGVTIVGQGGSALAVALKSKNPSLKSLGFAAGISALCGVTEPALYGINLRYKKTFISANIGSAVGGFIIGLMHVDRFSMAGFLMGFINPKGIDGNFYWAAIAGAACLATSFLLTYFWGFNDDMVARAKRKKAVNPAKMALSK